MNIDSLLRKNKKIILMLVLINFSYAGNFMYVKNKDGSLDVVVSPNPSVYVSAPGIVKEVVEDIKIINKTKSETSISPEEKKKQKDLKDKIEMDNYVNKIKIPLEKQGITINSINSAKIIQTKEPNNKNKLNMNQDTIKEFETSGSKNGIEEYKKFLRENKIN